MRQMTSVTYRVDEILRPNQNPFANIKVHVDQLHYANHTHNLSDRHLHLLPIAFAMYEVLQSSPTDPWSVNDQR